MAKLQVHVVAPEREVFTGQADMVVAKGSEGDVGILPGHAPMLVALAIHPVRLIDQGDERVVLVDGGFLHVTPGEGEEATRVDVLADHAVLPDEVDVGAARSQAEELRRRAEEGQVEARAEVLKALMRAEYGKG